MARITGKVTNFGGLSMSGYYPVLFVIPQMTSTYNGQMLSTKPIRVELDPVDARFDFTVIASEEMRPVPRPYSFHLQWLNGEGAPVGNDWWTDIWVPAGTWTISDLLGTVGISPGEVFWQPTPPDPWPLGAVWFNTLTGDYGRRIG